MRIVTRICFPDLIELEILFSRYFMEYRIINAYRENIIRSIYKILRWQRISLLVIAIGIADHSSEIRQILPNLKGFAQEISDRH